MSSPIDKMNPWYSRVEASEIYQSALTGFFPVNSPIEDSVVVWPCPLDVGSTEGKRHTLRIRNSNKI